MINNIESISIEGGYFDTPCSIPFFKVNNKNEKLFSRSVLIYGENGSGKSSLAQALLDFKLKSESSFQVSFNYKKQIEEMKSEVNKNVHVYNENFIDNEVKYAAEGLKAVVMFGEQVEVDQDINNKRSELNSLTDEIDIMENDLKTIKKNKDEHFELLKSQLQKDGGWADLDREIKGLSTKTAVSKSNLKQHFSTDVLPKDIKEYKRIFERKLKLYRNSNKEIWAPVSPLHKFNSDDLEIQEITELLKKEFHRPIKDETVQWLEKELDKRSINFYLDVKRTFESEKTDHCPYCMRSIDHNLKVSVLDTLNSIISSEIEELKSKLKQHLLQLPMLKKEEIEISKYENIDEETYKEIVYINSEFSKYNESIDYVQEKIKKKLDNPFKKYEVTPYFPNINDKIELINQKIIEYNQQTTDLEKTKEQLIRENKTIMNFEFKESYEKYNNLLKQIKDLKITLECQKNRLKVINEEILDLQQKKADTKIALDQINNYLSFIFFDPNRIALKPSNVGNYEVWVKGERVDLSKLSVGERNIISLCYFFSKINENQDGNINPSRLFIIDDPISSFDSQNKIGIISFLRNRIYNLFKENTANKLIILTHDLFTAKQLGKVFEDLNEQEKQTFKNPLTFELKNKELKELNFNNYNQISQLMCKLGCFAFSERDTDHDEMNIGNMLRRLLEGYATFNYKVSVSELFNNPEVLGKVDKFRQEYYSDKMYRLLLHGESHLKDQTKSEAYFDSFSFIGREEKKAMTKDVLAFLYELDSYFVKRHIAQIRTFSSDLNENNVIKKINEHIKVICDSISIY